MAGITARISRGPTALESAQHLQVELVEIFRRQMVGEYLMTTISNLELTKDQCVIGLRAAVDILDKWSASGDQAGATPWPVDF